MGRGEGCVGRGEGVCGQGVCGQGGGCVWAGCVWAGCVWAGCVWAGGVAYSQLDVAWTAIPCTSTALNEKG